MPTKRHLKAVPAVPVEPPKPSLDYEWQHRQRVAAKRWDEVHIRGDRGPAVSFPFLGLFRRRRGGRDL